MGPQYINKTIPQGFFFEANLKYYKSPICKILSWVIVFRTELAKNIYVHMLEYLDLNFLESSAKAWF